MNRHFFQSGNLTLSYLDSANDGKPIVALHSHWMEAATFESLASCLAPYWRLIALDQRGHGHSDHAHTYTREDYLNDIFNFLKHLALNQAVLLGNSLGGVNAYQFAARYPDRVQALIIEDIGAVVHADVNFVLSWTGVFGTREELEQRIGNRLLPYLVESFRKDDKGWHLAFDPQDMVLSQNNLNGDHWTDWLESNCPALLIHGDHSKIVTQAEMEEMAKHRPNTELITLAGWHVVHADNPSGFCEAVKSFLKDHRL